jgi:hypothetical protein
MKNIRFILVLTIVVVFSLLSGCFDSLLNIPTTYESHPTKISYTIVYGYKITCSGTGVYEINYDCDIPDILLGSQSYHPLYAYDFETITLVNNSYLHWNISGDDEKIFTLGISANIVAESFLVSDLSGSHALSIQEIAEIYPALSLKYSRIQSNGSAALIDPYNDDIQQTAVSIVGESETDNAFLVAKELFIWLEENTNYQTHRKIGGVQPAAVTFEKKTGDCDDLSFLYISLCRAVGIPARFIRGYLLTEDEFGDIDVTPHAWTEVFVGGMIGNNGWIPVECACDCDDNEVNVNQNFGVENVFHLRVFIDDGSNESLNISLSGISYVYGLHRVIELQSFNEVRDYRELESKKLVVTTDNQRFYE